MENKRIGIKVADGSFYPILDEGSAKKKRLVLTTVNDDQSSVQIDLYRGAGETLEGASYIGSLLVDEIEPKGKGEAEIELTLGVDEEGTLHSVAKDRASGLKQSFSVGLENLDESGLYEVPDFSLTEEEEEPLEGGGIEEDEDIFGGDFDLPEEEEPEASMEEPEEELGEDFELEEPEEESLELDTDLGEEALEDFSVDEKEVSLDENAFSLDEEAVEEPFEEELPDLEDEPAPVFEMDEEEDEENFDFSSLDEPPEEAAGELEEESLEDTLGQLSEEDLEEENEPAEQEEDTEPGWGKEYKHLKEGFEETSSREEKESGKAKPLLVVLLVILALALIGALLYLFVFVAGDKDTVPPLEAKDGQVQEQIVTGTDTGDAEETTPVEGAEAGAGGTAGTEGTPGTAVSGADLPSKDQVEFTGGVWYKIRWGDTLWEISSSFYDNPWLYGKIADENEIPNPDRIFAESSIFIPRQ